MSSPDGGEGSSPQPIEKGQSITKRISSKVKSVLKKKKCVVATSRAV
jgi:hypothetical protein